MRSVLSWISLSPLRNRLATLRLQRHLLKVATLQLKVAQQETLLLAERSQQLRLQLEMQPPIRVEAPLPESLPMAPGAMLQFNSTPPEPPPPEPSPLDQILGLLPPPISSNPSES